MDIVCNNKTVTLKLISGPKNESFPRPTDWKGYEVKMIGRHLTIVDEDCPDLAYKRIDNWISKTNIKYLGDKLLRTLYVDEVVKDIPDLYTLTVEKLQNVSSGNGVLGRSMATKICIEIDQTRALPTDIFMGSLGIKFLGRQQARLIGYATPDLYLSAKVESLAKEEGMGINKATDMVKSISSKIELINKLMTMIRIQPLEKPKANVDGPLAGVSFCHTGCRPTKEEEAILAAAGGVVKSGVSKGLSYLVMKEVGSGSAKEAKALSYGTKIITYDAFKILVGKIQQKAQ